MQHLPELKGSRVWFPPEIREYSKIWLSKILMKSLVEIGPLSDYCKIFWPDLYTTPPTLILQVSDMFSWTKNAHQRQIWPISSPRYDPILLMLLGNFLIYLYDASGLYHFRMLFGIIISECFFLYFGYILLTFLVLYEIWLIFLYKDLVCYLYWSFSFLKWRNGL